MTEARWRSLVRDHSLGLTQAEIDAGWHFCPCWDELLIGDKMGELEHCYCTSEYQMELNFDPHAESEPAF